MSDFNEDWADLGHSTDQEPPKTLHQTLEDAACITIGKVMDMGLKPDLSDAEGVSKVLEVVINTFMDELFTELGRQDVAGVVGFLIQSQRWTPSEVKGFVQSLPLSFLRRVVTCAQERENGYHLLFSLEDHRRAGSIDDYQLGRDGRGRLYVEFVHRSIQGDHTIRELLESEWDKPTESPGSLSLNNEDMITAIRSALTEAQSHVRHPDDEAVWRQIDEVSMGTRVELTPHTTIDEVRDGTIRRQLNEMYYGVTDERREEANSALQTLGSFSRAVERINRAVDDVSPTPDASDSEDSSPS